MKLIADAMKRKQNVDGNNRSNALSYLLLQDDLQMDSEEILEAGLELMFAGHETTASAICSLLLHLAKVLPLLFSKPNDKLNPYVGL